MSTIKKFLYFFHALLFVFLVACGKNKAPKEHPLIIHNAHLDAGWYPHNPLHLNAALDTYFTQAQKTFALSPTHGTAVRALIAPHAGMAYSGLCAAAAYQTLYEPSHDKKKVEKNRTIDRVIVLAPAHTDFFHGVALPSFTIYRTPLGDIPLALDALSLLQKSPGFRPGDHTYEQEHAIEMQLPFLQKTIADFELVPLIVGSINKEEELYFILQGLKKIITPTTLLVISSDFTHHGKSFDYNMFTHHISAQIRMLDSLAVQAICKRSFEDFQKVLFETDVTVCGQNPLKILLGLFTLNILPPLTPHVACAYTSAQLAQAISQSLEIDTKKLLQIPSDEQSQHSVSYVGIVFTDPIPTAHQSNDFLTGYEKQSLLSLARITLENSRLPLEEQCAEQYLIPLLTPSLQKNAGAFVTLNTRAGELRGCIGTLTTNQQLPTTIITMTRAAAFKDHRFLPLAPTEVDNVVIDITILTPPVSVASINDIIIGKHGVILNKCDEHGTLKASSVFLPQVPVGQGWNREKTLEELSKKAGLAKDAWKDGCSFEVFEGFEIKE